MFFFIISNPGTSIELVNFAEAQYLRENSENMKNLILSHRVSESILTDKKSSSLFAEFEDESVLNPQLSQLFDLEMGGYGFDITKLNNPGRGRQKAKHGLAWI